MLDKTKFVVQGTTEKGAVGYWTSHGLDCVVKGGDGLYWTYKGANKVKDKLSKCITSTHWEVRAWVPKTKSTRPVCVDDKVQEHEGVKVKAFIRYSSVDRKQVVYFRRGGRMFKMLDANNIKMMATRVTFNHWLRNISRDVKTTPVFEDEQVIYNGKPVAIPMDTVKVLEHLLN